MSNWPYFSECHELMNPEFMAKLIQLRSDFGHPLIVSSSFRTQAENQAMGGATKSSHLIGRAVDIVIRGEDALALVVMSFRYGMNGVGVNQKGKGRFIHLDDNHDTPTIWSY